MPALCLILANKTTEGLEQSFALLLLGPYILSERLHPLLAKSESARVVNVLSGGMYSQKNSGQRLTKPAR